MKDDRSALEALQGKISQATASDAAKRAATVERLRLEVAAGRYHPDPGDIARGIVGEALANTPTIVDEALTNAVAAGSPKK